MTRARGCPRLRKRKKPPKPTAESYPEPGARGGASHEGKARRACQGSRGQKDTKGRKTRGADPERTPQQPQQSTGTPPSPTPSPAAAASQFRSPALRPRGTKERTTTGSVDRVEGPSAAAGTAWRSPTQPGPHGAAPRQGAVPNPPGGKGLCRTAARGQAVVPNRGKGPFVRLQPRGGVADWVENGTRKILVRAGGGGGHTRGSGVNCTPSCPGQQKPSKLRQAAQARAKDGPCWAFPPASRHVYKSSPPPRSAKVPLPAMFRFSSSSSTGAAQLYAFPNTQQCSTCRMSSASTRSFPDLSNVSTSAVSSYSLPASSETMKQRTAAPSTSPSRSGGSPLPKLPSPVSPAPEAPRKGRRAAPTLCRPITPRPPHLSTGLGKAVALLPD